MVMVVAGDCCWNILSHCNGIIFEISGLLVGVLGAFYPSDNVAHCCSFGCILQFNSSSARDHCLCIVDNLIVTIRHNQRHHLLTITVLLLNYDSK